MSRLKVAQLHIAAWLIVPFAVIPGMVRAGASNSIAYWLTAYVFYISSFYISYFFILPPWVIRRRTFLLLLKWLGMIFVYTAAILVINRVFGMYQVGTFSFRFWDWFFTSASYMCILFFLSIFYRLALDWFKNDRTKQQLEQNNLRVELAFLKSQINPHFLFNTLNNIYVLAYQKSDQTPTAVLWLSEMMQYMLHESSGEKVPLIREIFYVEKFVALQRLRVKDELQFDMKITGDPAHYQIAPLILVNFVENIFKHAILTDACNPALMHLTLHKNQLTLYCHNKQNQSRKDQNTGIGLANVKRRLELIYPNRHDLQIISGETDYTTRLTIQFY